MSWQVRKARLEDASRIVELARSYDEFLMPYVLNEFVVRGYIDQFMVAEDEEGIVGGTVHCIPRDNSMTSLRFLFFVKQVPTDIIEDFNRASSRVFLGQIVCPGKGSFYAILEALKKQYDELWCWISIVGPSYKSYERYGFRFLQERKFWNVYKCGYSTFTLGKWEKNEGKIVVKKEEQNERVF